MADEPLCSDRKLRRLKPNSSVCYLIGAGFSAATRFRLPTSVGFLTREFNSLGNGEEEKVRPKGFDDALEGLFDYLEAEYGRLETLNLETIMTDLHVRAFGVGRAWEVGEPHAGGSPSVTELQQYYGTLQRYIALRLRLGGVENHRCELVARFVQSLKDQDSLVTLNYDTILEHHLAKHSSSGASGRLETLRVTVTPPGSTYGGEAEPMFHPYANRSLGVLAKLHGSVDWLTCPNELCPNHSYIYPVIAVTSASRRPFGGIYAEKCTCCGSSPETVIIPPTAAKAFDRFPKLSLMWLQAYHALRRAQRWVVIGVSFAETDSHLSALIRSASRDALYLKSQNLSWRVCVVDKKPEPVVDRLSKALAPTVAARLRSNSDDLVVFQSVDEYLQASAAIDANRRDQPPRDLRE